MSLSPRQKFELCVRVLLGIAFAFMAGVYFRNGLAALDAIDATNARTFQLGHALSVFVIGLYAASVAFIYAIRLQPVSRFAGFFPTLAALLGGFLMLALLFLPPNERLPLGVQIVSCVLVLAGNGFAVFILTQLGRSFSILPESRKLVTTGAYSVVRHPLYLAEAVAALGAVLIFLSPLAFALFVTQLGWQFVRMHYEEKILGENFPEYKKYAKRTKRLIPYIY
jgi:protein-S-isoprenylcysteine O-methyltransferase Ste14